METVRTDKSCNYLPVKAVASPTCEVLECRLDKLGPGVTDIDVAQPAMGQRAGEKFLLM